MFNLRAFFEKLCKTFSRFWYYVKFGLVY